MLAPRGIVPNIIVTTPRDPATVTAIGSTETASHIANHQTAQIDTVATKWFTEHAQKGAVRELN